MLKTIIIASFVMVSAPPAQAKSSSCTVESNHQGRITKNQSVAITSGATKTIVGKGKTLTLSILNDHISAELVQVIPSADQNLFLKYGIACEGNLKCKASHDFNLKLRQGRIELRPDFGPQTVTFFNGASAVFRYQLANGKTQIWIGDEYGITNEFTGVFISCGGQ